MPNIDDWQHAGLYDPTSPAADERHALLDFLSEQGLSIDDMRDAERHGRLFALAGDRILRGGLPTHSLVSVAAELDRDVELIAEIWRALRFHDTDSPNAPAATDNDVRAIRTALVLVDILGVDNALGLFRTYGRSLSQVADAASAAFRSVPEVSVRRSGSELTTAKTWADTMRFLADISHLLDVTHRHQIDASRRFFEASGTETEMFDTDRQVRLGVAMVDLSGFTALSQVLLPEDLVELLERFERTTHEVAARNDCRTVKFIGDAALVVSANAASVTSFGSQIVEAFTESPAARAGLAFGDVVAREGDYFGPAVNLAARLIGAAPPASVVASASFANQLHAAWESHPIGTHDFRGFDEPVEVVRISRRDE